MVENLYRVTISIWVNFFGPSLNQNQADALNNDKNTANPWR